MIYLFSIAPVMQYTDDSAMSKALAQSLIEKKDMDLVHLAKKFVKSFYEEPHRGYGPGVVTVCSIVDQKISCHLLFHQNCL